MACACTLLPPFTQFSSIHGHRAQSAFFSADIFVWGSPTLGLSREETAPQVDCACVVSSGAGFVSLDLCGKGVVIQVLFQPVLFVFCAGLLCFKKFII